MKERKKERASHFELLRIISMLMIIGSHFVQHAGTGGWQIMQEPFSFNTIWAYLFGTGGQLGVCLFIIISSWFLSESDGIHIKKVILINVECIFYTALFYCIIKFFGLEALGSRQFVKIFLTPWRDGYWFIVSYFCFYFCMPALQFYSKNVSVKSQGKILLVLTLLIPIYQFVQVKDHFGTVGSFSYLYLLCSYLKKKENNFIERHCLKLFLSSYLFILGCCLMMNILGRYGEITKFYAERNIFVMLEAISLFYIFKKYIKIGYHKAINEIAKTTLGIYILHESWLFVLYAEGKSLHSGGLLFEYLLHGGAFFHESKYFGLYFIAVILGIFMICSIIEYIRIWIFDKTVIGKIKRLDSLCTAFDTWYRIGTSCSEKCTGS